MPTFTRGDVSLHYVVEGSGFPVLLLAPGGMRSTIAWWERAPFHPLRALAGRFQLIAMDQRNAGGSRAPVRASDGWHSFTDDQLALLDHLGVERCHLLGQCIGGAFGLSLLSRAPERVAAAVLLQPIGFDGGNRDTFYQLFDSWADELRAGGRQLDDAAMAAFKSNLYDRDFVFSVTREQVAACQAPLLILRGNDIYHPAGISEEVARLAPRAELVHTWREGADLPRAIERVIGFLNTHTPG
jgi:pimeloyl-ACP methyl ester carboxylesterase